MGFDNECILNIQSLAGEYFCPVCRLLVIPNEALQSQCTHLYCKPCLAYIANSTKACPYDGYLVTEADSKPLVESNKTLAETIHKIVVHCLYHRSGCTWQGPLSDCVTHCSGCAFGSSPVVCNRCGTQIVHRQVQEHAQACPGVQPQAQQAGVSHDSSAAAKAVADQSHSSNQAGVPSTQVQTAQSTAAAAAPAQDPNQQAGAGIQAQAVSQAAVTTSEQWYQQQYGQYYQQYPGYYPYQQQYQQYYPYQQQAVLQPQLYPQPQAQAQAQAQAQTQTQVQPQPQAQPQSQPQLQPSTLPPTQVQAQQHVHAVSVPQAQNAQQQVLPMAHLQSQNPPSQPAFYPQGQSQATPQQYPAQSISQQHMQTQYQQPQVHMQYPNLQSQPQLQSQPNPNLQTQAQPSAQPLVQASHPQGQQHLPPPPPPVANQPTAQPHMQMSHAVTGYHSYPQAQASQQIQLGVPQQNPMNIRPQQLSQQPMQMQGQFSQPPSHVRPPQLAPIPNQQQPGLVPAAVQGSNVPATQQQPMFPYNQQPGNLAQQRPLVPSIQPTMSQQYGQQHQPPSVHQPGPPQSQAHSLTPLGQQQIPMQPQVRSQVPLQPSQPQQAAYPRPQQSAMGSFGSHASHQSQNLVGRPMMPTQGVLSQAGPVPVKPMQPGYNQNNLISSGGQIVGTSSEQQPDAVLHAGRAVTDQQVDTPICKIEKMDVPSSAGTSTVEMNAAKFHNGSNMGENKLIEVNRSADGTSLEKGGLPMYQMGKEASSMKEPTDGRLVEAEKFGLTISPKEQEQQATAPKDKVDGSSDRILPVQETELSKGRIANTQKDIREKGQPDRNLPHVQSNSFGRFPPHGQLHAGGMIQSSHPDALIDQGRHQPPMLQYGQSPHQQRPPVPMLQATPPGPQYGSPGLGQLPPGMRSPPNQFQQLAFNKPPETFPGIMPGNGLPTPYGRGQGPQSIPPQGPHIPGHLLSSRKSQDEMGLLPGVVDESSRMMGVKPLQGPEGELFNKRPFYADDRRPDSHPLNSVGTGLLGRPSGMHPDMMSMHRPPGMDPSSTFSRPDDRLKSLQNERLEPVLMEPSRNIRERRGFEEDMKHFGMPHDMDPDPFHRSGRFFPSGSPFDGHPLDKAIHAAGPERGPGSAPASSRSFLPHNHGTLFGETAFGPPEEDRGRFDSSRLHGPDRARMDSLSSQSPGRDYSGFSSRGLGGFGNDIERREHMPGDPAYFRRGEFEGPGHMRMGDRLRNDDLISHDFAPKNIRRGELLGPRDLPNIHMREYGGLRGPAHIGESFGPDSFGGNSHSRFGDTRFRSSFYPGGLELADDSRKRKVTSMGWCRICSVDCETVEGLDLHSQTREHQKAAMDMVLSIKQQNAKKQKVSSSGKTSVADASKSRTVGAEARGNKK